MFIYFLKSMGNIYSFTLPAKVSLPLSLPSFFSLFFWVINFGTRCSRKILTETNLSPFISPLLFFSGLLIFFFLARYSKKINERQITLFFSREKSEKDYKC